MLAFFAFGFLGLLLAFLSKINSNQYYLLASFFISFIFQAFRYNYGNDYMSYMNIFKEINSSNFVNYYSNNRIEIGWIILNKLFSNIGFFGLIVGVSLILSWSYYKFVVTFCSKDYWFFSFFLFYFDPNILLVNITAIRQSMAISFFILSIIFYYRQKNLMSALLCCLSILFHSSAFILLPIFIISSFLQRFSYVFIKIRYVFLVLFLLSFYVATYFNEILLSLNLFLFKGQYYEYTVTNGIEDVSIFNVIFYSYLFWLALYYYPRESDQTLKHIFIFFILGLYFIPFTTVFPLIGRMSFYFLPLLIPLISVLSKQIKSVHNRYLVYFPVIIVTLVRLYRFFISETYSPYFTSYKTIFELWN